MKRVLLVSIFFLTPFFHCNAQYETDTHIIWQPGVKLTYEMFQGALPDSAQVEKLKGLNIYHSIATGFWSALDVPDSKRGWKTMYEKFSFCAAVDKTQSYFIVRDSTELKYAQLIWDICELATRVSRRNLLEFDTELNKDLDKKANGAISIYYMTALNDGKEFGRKLTQILFETVITTHNEEAYQKCRAHIDSLLLELEEYATTEEEIKRLLYNSPAKGYKMAPALNHDWKDRGELIY